jgi:hypothetical protein|tara:strand:- start:1534 stop:1785 length:252 start_codon:yes stop_codon:yes gene_type:complete
MTTLWFLMVLVTTPLTPAVAYQGFAAYHTKEICESKRIIVENYVGELEDRLGRTSYIQSYCIEVEAFNEAIKKFKGIENDTDA